MTPIDSWRVRAPGVMEADARGGAGESRTHLLLGAGLLLVELAWVAALIWVLSLVL